MWPVILQKGSNQNQTLATIKFDQFGVPTKQQIYACDDWAQGFDWAQTQGYTQALFVKSGTVFTDWPTFVQLVDNYPHQGLIGHIIWPPDQRPSLDDQCWFMNLDQFDIEDFTPTMIAHPNPIRSDQNLHDDYTPLWIRSGTGKVEYVATRFGQGLIARQLHKNQTVVNWNNTARDLKRFTYEGAVDLTPFQNYKDLAENQLWIFNNEPVTIVKKSCLLTPGSGLSWILNLIDPATNRMQIVDVSRTQIKFCKELWNNWDGDDYGSFVWNFIDHNQLIHYELDNPTLTTLERLQLKGRTKFIQYVNSKFDQQIPENFKQQWQLARQNKQVDFCNSDLIKWVLDNNTDTYDHVWCSNILNYKWTLLHTTVEQYDLFQAKIK
jgi:hypothetical protein